MSDEMQTAPELLASMDEFWRTEYVPRIPETPEAVYALQLALDFLAVIAKSASDSSVLFGGDGDDDIGPGSTAQALAVLFGVATVGTWTAGMAGITVDMGEE